VEAGIIIPMATPIQTSSKKVFDFLFTFDAPLEGSPAKIDPAKDPHEVREDDAAINRAITAPIL
jgi:hypothetical protein